ncbi:MAG: outer membrane lipoprotein carrier protein LolA [Treponema sp.]|nr:outer membrane lipoprotein carrier protein LolA [Treponema sp.]MBP5748034.1 outer membrane lipoprotein carrier protein LolA [Treponema sp.]
MKKLIALAAALCCCAAISFAQVKTAGEFFKSVSDYYAEMRDYVVTLNIDANGKKMAGTAMWHRPQFLRINFSYPGGQTFVYDGDELFIYLPSQATVLEQKVLNAEQAVPAKGLSLLRRYYTITYESGQDPVPLEEGSSTKVIKLLLTRRSAAEEFTTMTISILPDSKLIRRIVAHTQNNGTYVFNFTGWSINAGVPLRRFEFEMPPDINSYNNFLLSE